MLGRVFVKKRLTEKHIRRKPGGATREQRARVLGSSGFGWQKSIGSIAVQTETFRA
jgi:hypothetical protein